MPWDEPRARYPVNTRMKPAPRITLSLPLLTLLLAACASAPPPSAGTDISGAWKLDVKASDDVNTRIDQAIATAEEKRRRLHRPDMNGQVPDNRGVGAGPGPLSGTAEAPFTPRLGPNFKEMRAQLRDVLAVPTTLNIDAVPDLVRIQADGTSPREYRPGSTFTRFDEYGTARITPNWSGTNFQLTSHYLVHGSRSDQYHVDKTADTLTVTFELADPDLGKLVLRSLYRRE